MSVQHQPSSSNLRVIDIDFRTDPRWERFVAAHPDGCVFHHPGWLQALEKEYGQRCLSLACEDAEGELRGVLPLFYTRGLPFNIGQHQMGRRLSSLPRTPVAGPLSTDREATVALVQAAVHRVRKDPSVQLELKMQEPGLEELVDGLVCKPWRFTYVQELPHASEELRFGNSRNYSRIKWAINKASKLGVLVRPAETEGELRAWYQLYLETMRDNGVPARPYRLFAALWELLRPRGMMRLLLAEQQKAGRRRLLAGSMLLMFGRTVFYAFNGRRHKDLSLRPNDILQWQGIHDACKSGFRWYDFGEVPHDRPQLADFKSKWGAQPKRLYRYYYQGLHGSDVSRSVSNGYIRCLSEVWRRLPLKVSAQLSDWLYGYL